MTFIYCCAFNSSGEDVLSVFKNGQPMQITISNIANKTLITAGGMAYFQVGNFLLAVLVVRVAGIESMGVFQLFIVTSTFFSYFGRVGHDERLTYTLAKEIKEGNDSTVSSEIHQASFSALKYSLLSVVGLMLFYIFLEDGGGGVGVLALIYLPSFVLSTILVSVYRAENNIILRSTYTYIIPTTLNILIFIGLSFSNFLDVNTPILSRTLAYFILLGVVVYYVNRRYPFFSNKIDSASVSVVSTRQYLIWMGCAVFSFMIESGTIIVWGMKITATLELLGLFTVLMRLSSLVVMVPTALNVVMAPQLAGGRSISKRVMLRYISSNSVMSLFMVFMVYSFTPLILKMFGSEYLAYADYVPMMLFSSFLLSLSSPFQVIALAKKKVSSVLLVNFLSVTFTVSVVVFIGVESISDAVNTLVCVSVFTACSRSFLLVK